MTTGSGSPAVLCSDGRDLSGAGADRLPKPRIPDQTTRAERNRPRGRRLRAGLLHSPCRQRTRRSRDARDTWHPGDLDFGSTRPGDVPSEPSRPWLSHLRRLPTPIHLPAAAMPGFDSIWFGLPWSWSWRRSDHVAMQHERLLRQRWPVALREIRVLPQQPDVASRAGAQRLGRPDSVRFKGRRTSPSLQATVGLPLDQGTNHASLKSAEGASEPAATGRRAVPSPGEAGGRKRAEGRGAVRYPGRRIR